MPDVQVGGGRSSFPENRNRGTFSLFLSRETEAPREGKAGLYLSQANTAPCHPPASFRLAGLGNTAHLGARHQALSPETAVANGLEKGWGRRLGPRSLRCLTLPIFRLELTWEEGTGGW